MISLSNPTERQTEARIVRMGYLTLYFSYETCFAFRYRNLEARRSVWHFSRTTKKHMREMGTIDFPFFEMREFEQRLQAVITTCIDDMNRDI